MPIHVLTPEVTAQIAAGEVVERPASVVKELVENSLDAGARRVDVSVEEGGRRLIRVSDDGHGIAAADMPLALARHATSKLTDLADLDALHTLGFRGEALASIAAVSRLELCARCDGAPSAHEYVVEAGERVRQGLAARTTGTTVTVRGLFRPTPARFKFLRSIPAEHARIQAVLAAYALAAPDVQFHLLIDGRDALATPGDGDLRSVLRTLYADDADQLLALTPPADRAGVTLDGYTSAPTFSRATREHLWLFVNGRWIQHRGLSAAIEAAYRTLLQVGRHPVTVVRLTVPPDAVDVNVHPAKTEVRFRRDRDICAAAYTAVQNALLAFPVVPEVPAEPTAWQWPAWQPAAAPAPAARTVPTPNAPTLAPSPPSAAPAAEPLRQVPFPRMPVLRVLGQVDHSYIITEGPEGLYLIDQHAAHERILYDRLRAASRDGAEPQYLLEPAPLTLSSAQLAAHAEQAELFRQLGFVLEPFGGNTLLLRAAPSALSGTDPSRALLDVLDEMAEEHGTGISYGEAALWGVACRAAIKAGQPLAPDEMQELVRQLEATSSPQTCAHGRPTMIHVSVSQLERQFGRK